jgi:glycosyltransferase involved in cell wall biosynthesis
MKKEIKPKVSICIPLYNRKKYVIEAVESAINQTFKEIEVIVLNDGSTDGSGELLEELNLPIKLYHQKNTGHARAINRLIDLADGDYIVFLDSDDVFMEDTVERLYNAAENYDNIAVAYGGYFRVNAAGIIIGECKRKLVSGKITNQLFQDNLVHNVGTLIPKSIFNDIGKYSTKFKDGYDLHLALKISIKYDFVHVEEPVFKRRRHDSNISTFSFVNVEGEIKVLEDFYYNLGGRNVIKKSVARKRLGKEYYRLGKAAVMDKRDDIRKYFMKALMINFKLKYLLHYILGK